MNVLRHVIDVVFVVLLYGVGLPVSAVVLWKGHRDYRD